MEEIAKRFGRNLHVARWEARIKQKDLAAQVFVDPAVLSRLERGERLPRLDHIVSLAKVLGMPVSDLLQGIG